MGITSNHSNHIPKPILHHHLLAEVVYRIRLLPNLQIQITMNKEDIQTLTPIEKVQTLIALIDTPIGKRKYPKDLIRLAQSLKEDFPLPNPQQE